MDLVRAVFISSLVLAATVSATASTSRSMPSPAQSASPIANGSTEPTASPSPSPSPTSQGRSVRSATPSTPPSLGSIPLRGQLVDNAGRPLAFADFQLSAVHAETSPAPHTIRFTTDATGSFQVLASAKVMSYSVAPANPKVGLSPTVVQADVLSRRNGNGEFPKILLPEVNSQTYHIERVYFVTDRRAQSGTSAMQDYGGARSNDGALQFGAAKISIPNDHRLGSLERPWSIFSLYTFPEDPSKHVTVREVRSGSRTQVETALRDDLRSSGTKSVLVFIHGYSVTFADALRRTAQIRYDLQFDGPSIAYSWPSQGTFWGYGTDENNIEWTQPHLEAFLRDIAERTGARHVDIIAHSMGNRALLRSLAYFAERQRRLEWLHSVALCAPDVDQEVFRELVGRIGNKVAGLTLYASSRDQALLWSMKFHGYARAGQTTPAIVVLRNLSTIDASAVDTDLTGHGYYGDNVNIIADIWSLVRGIAMPHFHLQRVMAPEGLPYWRFVP